MAIFGIGAFYDEDVSKHFIEQSLVGVGWDAIEAPELHQFMRSLRVGDLVYIKSFPPASPEIFVKAIGIVIDAAIRTKQDSNDLVSCGRNVRWLSTSEFQIPLPPRRTTSEETPCMRSTILSCRPPFLSALCRPHNKRLQLRTMWKDPIVEEIRSRREELAQHFNYDIKTIGEALRRQQMGSGQKPITRSPKRVRTTAA